MRFLTQLRTHLGDVKARYRARRVHAEVLDVEIAEDIVDDVARAHDLAYNAEQADLEAARLLVDSLADGHLNEADLPKVRLAIKHIERSAQRDHQITQALA